MTDRRNGVGSVRKIDPEVAGERLAAIKKGRGGGVISPAAVVEDARPKDSPLHPAFEWCDAAAAKRYREEGAAE